MEEHAADDDDARNNDTENPPLRKAPTKQQQSPSSSYQTPHTLRLLQLIRDGSPEYAETAVARLQATVTTMMTTSSSSCSFNASTNEPPATNLVVLWDLLGRLALLLLQSPSFATRHTAATALCAVARSVPGHREFLAAPHSSLSVPPPTITTRKRMPLDDDNDTTTTTPLADQQPQQQPRQSLDPPDTTNLSSSSSMPSPDDSSFLVLTVRDLTETATTGTNITGLDRVLESGRELWATAPSRYATRRPDEKDWDDDDDDVRMDSLHPSQTLDNDTKPPTTTRRWLSPYVQARVDYQRRILARRLGLSAVESVLNHRGPIELGAFPSDMYELVSPEDFLALEDPSDDKDRTERRSPRQKAVVGKTNDNRKSTANPQHTTRKRKRTRHYTDHTDNDDDAAQDDAHTRAVAEAVATEPSNNNNSTSIRALLVREMLHQPRSSSSSEQSHHSPQTLLATELIYRLMDPVWYVRHGAALGILALIRAWRNQDFSPGSDVTTTVLYSGLGVWPEDILARCLCVLALDRFGDFSGGALDAAAQHSACCSSFLVVSSSSLSTSVVAPVREVVGQVVALLLAMSTTTIKKIEEDGITPSSASNSEKITNVAENAMSILYRLCRYPSEWEVRHGAIIALKYVVVLLTNAADLQHKDSNPTSRWSILFHSNAWLLQPGNNPVESIAHLATELLMDGSDDVKSVAAQTLFEMARVHPHSSKEHHETVADVKSDLPGYLWESVPALWRAITNVKSVSSCIVDLVALLALFVSHNRDAFLQRIPVGLESAKTSENQHHSIVAFRIVVDFFLGLFDSNFPAVRVSALRSIGTLCHETLVCSQLVRGPVEYQALFDTYTLLLERIFELFYGVPDDANGTLNEYPIDLLDECWKLLCDTCVESSFSGYTAKYERGVSDINSASSSNMARTSVKESLSTRQKLGDLAFCPFDTIDPELSTAALNTKLLTRFFRIGMERSTETKDTLEHVASAKALSYFFGRPSNFHRVHEIAQTALIACFHSPWTSHCEAACLLYRALSMRLNDRSSLRAFEDVLRVDVVLQCLAGTLINEHLSVEWDRAFLLLIQSPGVVKSIDDVTFPSRGALVVGLNDGEVSAKRQEVSSVVAMRVRAILCGAVISKGLPTVLTPLIRSLMTSFNNESTSATRHDQTGKYLTQSLLLMSQETKFEKAYRKVVNALCDAVSETNDINPVERITSRETVAVAVLRSLVGSLPWDNFFSDGSPLKCRLECILTARDSIDDSELADSISLLQIFCGSLDLHGNDSPSLIDTYVPALVTIACLCNIGAVAHNRASSCLESFCSKNPSHSLRAIIPCLTQNLKNRRNDQIRLSTCFALEKMVKASGSYICPYVRQLLPLVLSLVTDRVVECAHLAHSIFAALVRVAPLLRRDTVTSLQPTTQSENVIDHLIFGEPLPKCTYPTRISDALHAKNITLRGYQEEGVAWLRFLWTVNLSGALCDDMGVGKSIQALIAVAFAHFGQSPKAGFSRPISLVVCPSTLIGHWKGEIEKYFPTNSLFHVLCIEGSNSRRKEIWAQKPDNVSIVVTSYSVLRTDIEYLECTDWCYCILDEGHLLKNPKSATARASRRLRARSKLILTGTPIQNRVLELWAIFDFLMPNFLGTSAAFAKEYANPISKSQLPNASASMITNGLEKLKALHQQVLPFILRREKEQVLNDLPMTTLTVVRVPMSGLQSCIYRDFCSGKSVSQGLDSFGKALDGPSSGLSHLSGDVFKSLLFLRMLCTHPALVMTPSQHNSCPEIFFSMDASGKMLALAQLLREAGLAEDDITGADNDASLLYCDDDVANTDDQDSYSDVLELPDQADGSLALKGRYLNKNPTKCLIFAQFSKSLDAVEEFLFKAHMPSLGYVRLDGTVPTDKRAEVLVSFEKDPHVRVLLLTTRVGGLGLNLTAANKVIFLELDFNPYADIQAQDRCRRIGQTKQVDVYKIVTCDSIEETILFAQAKKVQVAEAVVTTENSTMFSMGTDRMLDIFSKSDSIRASNKMKFDFDLEAFVDTCARDYKFLSVDQFTEAVTSEK